MKMFIIAALAAFFFTVYGCHPTHDRYEQLRAELQAYTDTLDAQVGMALLTAEGDSLTLNNTKRYDMMSVFKFHQALAVCNYLQRHALPLDTLLHITSDDLKPDTWSPLRDKYLQEESADGMAISIRSLLEYTLQQSDNNACDLLFRLYGGPQATDRYIRSLGLTDFAVQVTEDDMHRDTQTCYDNWSTPLEAVRLLEIFLKKLLFAQPIQDFLKTTLMECKTGTDRLPAPLAGTGARIGHKTGTSDQDASGRWTAINDMGFVLLPDGRYYTIAVFVKHSRESAENTARIIADISRLVYSSFSKNR